jgi:hypothetical protein
MRRRACANGYRFTKPQGKPNFTIAPKRMRRRHFCDLALAGAIPAFTPRSSRTLNCSSNFIGHDDPNKPANGVDNDRAF